MAGVEKYPGKSQELDAYIACAYLSENLKSFFNGKTPDPQILLSTVINANALVKKARAQWFIFNPDARKSPDIKDTTIEDTMIANLDLAMLVARKDEFRHRPKAREVETEIFKRLQDLLDKKAGVIH